MVEEGFKDAMDCGRVVYLDRSGFLYSKEVANTQVCGRRGEFRFVIEGM